MSALEILFPSQDKVERARELMENVQHDTARGVYRPTPEATQDAWNALAEAVRQVQQPGETP